MIECALQHYKYYSNEANPNNDSNNNNLQFSGKTIKVKYELIKELIES